MRVREFAGLMHCALSVAAILAAGAGVAQQPLPEMPIVVLSAGMHLIRAEVAADFENRARGLMFRKSLGPNQGMLFVFEGAQRQCMWMKNTLIPLSVAFIDADGSIANTADMKPHDESSHCSVRSVPYALEMDRGWFASHGLKPGSRIGGLEKAPRPR